MYIALSSLLLRCTEQFTCTLSRNLASGHLDFFQEHSILVPFIISYSSCSLGTGHPWYELESWATFLHTHMNFLLCHANEQETPRMSPAAASSEASCAKESNNFITSASRTLALFQRQTTQLSKSIKDRWWWFINYSIVNSLSKRIWMGTEIQQMFMLATVNWHLSIEHEAFDIQCEANNALMASSWSQ